MLILLFLLLIASTSYALHERHKRIQAQNWNEVLSAVHNDLYKEHMIQQFEKIRDCFEER